MFSKVLLDLVYVGEQGIRVNGSGLNENFYKDIVYIFVPAYWQQKPIRSHVDPSYQAVVFQETEERVLVWFWLKAPDFTIWHLQSIEENLYAVINVSPGPN